MLSLERVIRAKPSTSLRWLAKASGVNQEPGLGPRACAGIWAVIATWSQNWLIKGFDERHLVFCKGGSLCMCVGNEGVMAFLWVLRAFYFIQLSTAAQRELTEPQKRLTSTTAIICEEWERAMCCTSFFSRLLIFFCLHTGTRASTQHSLSWGAWQHSPLLANLMKPNKVICALSIPSLGWLLSWGKKGWGVGIRLLDLGPCYHSYHKHLALEKLKLPIKIPPIK